MEKTPRLKRFSAFNALLWSASAAIIALAIGLGIIAFGPIDVLKNWHTSVGGEGKTFVAGQVVYFESQSEKLLSVPGTADRQLICDAKGTLIEREIAIDAIDLKRPAGVNPPRKNGLNLPTAEAFKDQAGDQTLPRVCRIHFNACYNKIYGFRDLCEQSETEKFTVVENVLPEENTDNSNDVADIPSTTFESQTSRSEPSQLPSNSTANTTNETTNNTTTVVAEEPRCVVDINLLGLVPVKLICQ